MESNFDTRLRCFVDEFLATNFARNIQKTRLFITFYCFRRNRVVYLCDVVLSKLVEAFFKLKIEKCDKDNIAHILLLLYIFRFSAERNVLLSTKQMPL
jgi:hypothetical protein